MLYEVAFATHLSEAVWADLETLLGQLISVSHMHSAEGQSRFVPSCAQQNNASAYVMLLTGFRSALEVDSSRSKGLVSSAR